MSLKSEDKQKIMRCAIIVLIVVCIASLGLLGLSIWESRKEADSPILEEKNSLKFEGKEYILKDNIETFLVIGLDKFEGDIESEDFTNDQQADFLMLFVFNNSTKECTALHINRDTMTNIKKYDVKGEKVIDTVYQQIALAHIYRNGDKESCQNTSETVSGLLKGIKINHYMSVTMDAVPVYNDLVGGVTLEVLADFKGIDDTLIKGETVTLSGKQALRYVRTRKGLEDSTNSTRMIRQRQYIEALYEQTLKCAENDDSFLLNALLDLSEYTVTDCTDKRLQTISEKLSEYKFLGIKELEGESKMGEQFIEFYPDENLLTKTVIDLFYKEK